jgi:hypothetical protein
LRPQRAAIEQTLEALRRLKGLSSTWGEPLHARQHLDSLSASGLRRRKGNSSRRSITTSWESRIATTVAVRLPPPSSASSPNISPGPIIANTMS